jgi:lipoprotein-releasing system permease protein
MILSLAVSTGFKDAIKEKLYSFSGHVHVTYFDPLKSNGITSPPIYYDKRLQDSLKRIPHVVSVVPFAQRPVIIRYRGKMEGIRLKGVEKDYHLPPSVTTTGQPINYADSSYSRQIMISQRTADLLDVRPGDTVMLQFFESGSTPRLRKARVSGTFHSGMEDVDKYYALCDLRLLQRMNNWTADSINAWQLTLDNDIYADTVSNYIHYNLVNAPVDSFTTEESNGGIFDWLQLQSMNSIILLIIMAVVAFINVSGVILVLMIDRAAMVGLLKTLGMPFGSIGRVFINVGTIISAIGILAGNILALALCWLQKTYGLFKLNEATYFMKYVPVKVVWWHIALTDTATLIVFVIYLWLPALYIRRIQPAKVLQFK